jgi:hypothetical protein
MTEKLKNIIACLDMQGFYVNGKFVPREIALVDDEICARDDIKTGLSLETLAETDISKCLYLTNHFHGLSLDCSTENAVTLSEALEKIKSYIILGETNYFGVKNHMLEKLLTDNGIPYLDLNQIGCPSVRYLDSMYNEDCNCTHHEKSPVFRCALRKCRNLWKWVKEV